MLLQRTEETEQLVFKTEILKSLSLSETNINKVFFGTNNKLYITVRETEVTDVYHFVNLCYGLTLEVDNIKISSPDNLELNTINFRANDITIENKCLNNCGILSDLLHLQNTIVTNCDIGVMWLNADWNTIQHIFICVTQLETSLFMTLIMKVIILILSKQRIIVANQNDKKF